MFIQCLRCSRKMFMQCRKLSRVNSNVLLVCSMFIQSLWSSRKYGMQCGSVSDGGRGPLIIPIIKHNHVVGQVYRYSTFVRIGSIYGKYHDLNIYKVYSSLSELCVVSPVNVYVFFRISITVFTLFKLLVSLRLYFRTFSLESYWLTII